jgi:hypothetical protein
MTRSMVTRLLASDLNPPHDTRHHTRLPVLTEVDGSIGPLEELDDTRRTADSRPQISLPKISENILPSTRRTLFRTGPTGQTPYQILVLTQSVGGVC